jgi:hypothetical protein
VIERLFKIILELVAGAVLIVIVFAPFVFSPLMAVIVSLAKSILGGPR